MSWRALAEPGVLRAGARIGADLRRKGFGAGPGVRAAPWADRLGWIELPGRTLPRLGRGRALGEKLRAEGCERLLVVGMGGSGIASRSLVGLLPRSGEGMAVRHLDSLEPEAIRVERDPARLRRTAVLVASKSGVTAESMVIEAVLRSAAPDPDGQRRRLLAVSDPGSPLFRRATAEGWRAVLPGNPDVGGRFAALGPYGAAPAVLGGRDMASALGPARALSDRLRRGAAEGDGDVGFDLGGLLVALARAGRTRALISASTAWSSILPWVEQMLAESTGKDGRGILPVLLPGVAPPPAISERDFLIHFGDLGDGGSAAARADAAGAPAIWTAAGAAEATGEIFRWQVAIAAAAMGLGVNPFDQPDVEGAKREARRFMESPAARRAGVLESDAAAFFRAASTGGLAVNAYGHRNAFAERAFARLQRDLARRLGSPPAVGFGSALLHSLGQMEKGGPPGLAVLILSWGPAPEEDIPIPPSPALPEAVTGLGAGAFVRLQAMADCRELVRRGRHVLWLDEPASGDRGLDALLTRLRRRL